MRAGVLAVAGVLLVAGCAGSSRATNSVPSLSPARVEPGPNVSVSEGAALADVTAPREPRLAEVTSWVYQLQGVDPDELSDSDFDLAVVDAAGDDGEEWSSPAVETMRTGGRIVLSYLSIGEAETYRDYWDPSWDADSDGLPDDGAPAWLWVENPDWEGNYLVRYWDPQWQELIGRKLDAIVAAGFDGVYLDIVDAYERWPRSASPRAADDMAVFVTALAERARAVDAGFLVFPQNASGLLVDLDGPGAERYLATVDGIGAEDTFFFGDRDHDNRYDPQWDTIELLDRFVNAGKVVLAVDYLTDPDLAQRFVDESHARGFVPYVGPRDLDRVVGQPARGSVSGVSPERAPSSGSDDP